MTVATSCACCEAGPRTAAYELRAPTGRVKCCLRCTLLHRPLARRSLIIALVVGTILTAINQGNLMVRGAFPAALTWKVPLTYAVPYCVATAGAVLNARRTKLN